MSATDERLKAQLTALKMPRTLELFPTLSGQAARENWTHVDYLARLVDAESAARDQRALERRLAAARFPVIKTLETFRWDWPKKINRAQVQNLMRLGFVESKTNVVMMGGVGLGTMPGSGLCRVA